MAPRTEVIKLIWRYINSNLEKNPADKKEIVCDAKFKELFGGVDAINMFQMTKHLCKARWDEIIFEPFSDILQH